MFYIVSARRLPSLGLLLWSRVGVSGSSYPLSPAASRALIIPVIIVALIYKIGHLEDWSKFDVFMLLAFQVAISFFAASLLGGHFQTAIVILVVFAGILAVIAGFMKNL